VGRNFLPVYIREDGAETADEALVDASASFWMLSGDAAGLFAEIVAVLAPKEGVGDPLVEPALRNSAIGERSGA
jgi:hypothetical protein